MTTYSVGSIEPVGVQRFSGQVSCSLQKLRCSPAFSGPAASPPDDAVVFHTNPFDLLHPPVIDGVFHSTVLVLLFHSLARASSPLTPNAVSRLEANPATLVSVESFSRLTTGQLLSI